MSQDPARGNRIRNQEDDGVASVKEGLDRIRNMLDRTTFLMGKVDERSREIELLVQKATELMSIIRDDNSNHDHSGLLSAAAFESPTQEEGGLAEVVEAITSEIRELRRERSRYFIEAASEVLLADQEKQLQSREMEALYELFIPTSV